MTALYSTEEEIKFLRRPHVQRAWFAELHLPSGIARVHPGVGNFKIGYFEGDIYFEDEWRGLSDPLGPMLVHIDPVEDPRFGTAVSVNILISGANKEFIRYIHENAAAIEGVQADLYWAPFDAETGLPKFGLKRAFPGMLSAPAIEWEGVGRRTVAFTIESIWLSQDDPYGGTWSYIGQKKRALALFGDANDLGGQYIGVRVQETW